MGEVTGPVIGITAVLMAVFLPAASMGGVTGPLYRQFALTIAGTALISAINALTLKPAQCARWLKPATQEKGAFARAFERVYGPLERGYARVVERVVRAVPLFLCAFVVLVGLTAWGYEKLPSSFLPTEDQGYVLANAQLPDAASLERTRDVSARIGAILGPMPGVRNWFVLGGFSLLDGTNASNAATSFIIFDDWSEREGAGLDLSAMTGRLAAEFGAIQEANVFAIVPPAIQGLGVGGGFQLQVEDRVGQGREALAAAVQELVGEAAHGPEIGQAFSTFRPGVPQVYVDVNRVQAKQLGLQLGDVFGTLQAALGSLYVNDINKFGRTYQVRVQADDEFRMEPDDVRRLFVRNQQGEMVPLGAVAPVESTFGPETIGPYNQYTTEAINCSAAPRRSSGEALRRFEEIAATKLPPGMGTEWTAMSFQEKRVGGQALWVYSLAIVLVYLVLAFLYESWLLPLAVILVVPLGLLGSVAALWLRGLENNVYTQIGMVLIIALASKNAILIVEFARELRASGRGRAPALPPDPDDLAGLHPRRGAAGVGARRGRRQPPVPRHGRVRRHDRGDRARGRVRAGVLRGLPVAERATAAGALAPGGGARAGRGAGVARAPRITRRRAMPPRRAPAPRSGTARRAARARSRATDRPRGSARRPRRTRAASARPRSAGRARCARSPRVRDTAARARRRPAAGSRAAAEL